MTRLVILGAGGHGRVIADCAEKMGEFSSIVFLDDGFPDKQQSLAWPVIGKISEWQTFNDDSVFIVGIGQNAIRQVLTNMLIKHDAPLTNVVHPSAYISKHCSLGVGNAVFANSVINCGTYIGNACIINTAATIDHDCKLEDACHISPGVNVAGGVSIGEESWLGIGSTVIECVRIEKFCQIGAGTVVISNTEAHSLYVGVPAKRIR